MNFSFGRLFLFSQVISIASFAQSLMPDPDRRSYDSVQEFLKQVVNANSQNASLVTVGDSDSGKKIIALKSGNGPVANLVVATHHGNEYGSTEVALAFARDVAEHPIANQTIYVIPVLNISGYEKSSRYETGSNGSFDANRDYPGPCGTEGPWHLKSTQALNKFLVDKNIIATATLHTYWPTVAYPWGNSTDNYSSHYDDLFKKLADAATSLSHYQTGFSGEVIYPADGTYEDFVFWEYGIWSLLFELGTSHFPNTNDINEMIRTNVPGLRKMMETAPTARADQHAFTANCSKRKGFDPHIE